MYQNDILTKQLNSNFFPITDIDGFDEGNRLSCNLYSIVKIGNFLVNLQENTGAKDLFDTEYFRCTHDEIYKMANRRLSPILDRKSRSPSQDGRSSNQLEIPDFYINGQNRRRKKTSFIIPGYPEIYFNETGKL